MLQCPSKKLKASAVLVLRLLQICYAFISNPIVLGAARRTSQHRICCLKWEQACWLHPTELRSWLFCSILTASPRSKHRSELSSTGAERHKLKAQLRPDSMLELEHTCIYHTLLAPYPLWELGPLQPLSLLPHHSLMRSCCWSFLVLWSILVLCFDLLWSWLLWHAQASQDQAVSAQAWLVMQLVHWAAACLRPQFCLQQRARLLCLPGQWVCLESAGSWWQLCHSPQLVAPTGNKRN